MDYGPVPNKMDMYVCVREEVSGKGRERVRKREGEGVCENLMVKKVVNVT